MRGGNRPTARQHGPHDRSGVRSAGRVGGVIARATAVVAAVGAVALAAATPAGAHDVHGQLTSGQPVTAVGIAQSDPMLFGLGAAGLFWLLAGLLALVVGLVLATRRVRKPAVGGTADTGPSSTMSTNDHRAGGAEK